MKSTILALAAVTAAGSASAQIAAYGQCGGTNWTGETACESGWSCHKYNDYYSQCLEGAGESTKATNTKTASTSTEISMPKKPASTKASTTTQNAAVKPATTKPSSTAQASSTTKASPSAVNRAGSSSEGVKYAGVNVGQHARQLPDPFDY